jgi:hypothetical protein
MLGEKKAYYIFHITIVWLHMMFVHASLVLLYDTEATISLTCVTVLSCEPCSTCTCVATRMINAARFIQTRHGGAFIDV